MKSAVQFVKKSLSLSPTFLSSPVSKTKQKDFSITLDCCVSSLLRAFSTFEEGFRCGNEQAAQMSIFSANKPVFTACGSVDNFHKTQKLHNDSLNVVHSTGKVVESLILAFVLEASKNYSYHTKIAEIWPEFGVNGKEDINIADLMRHDAGVPFLENILKKISNKDLENTKKFAAILADAKPVWLHKNSKLKPKERIYHAQTRGFFLNEVIRRIDHQGRTMGQILKNDIIPLLDDKNIVLGIKNHKDNESLTSNFFPNKFFQLPQDLKKVMDFKLGKSPAGSRPPPSFLKTVGTDNQAFILQLNSVVSTLYNPFIFSKKNFIQEGSSYNLLASASALAGMVDQFLLRGHKSILTQDSINRLLEVNEGSRKFDHVMGYETIFTQGGLCLFEAQDDPNIPQRYVDEIDGLYGWGGYGGSALVFDLQKKLVFSYVPASMKLLSAYGISDPRFTKVLQSAYASL